MPPWHPGEGALYGNLPRLEDRIAELTKRRDLAAQQLADALRDPVVTQEVTQQPPATEVESERSIETGV
jgi:hypothetical protein